MDNNTENNCCTNCNKKITYKDGLCKNCYISKRIAEESEEDTTNNVAKIIKVLAIILSILGIIVGLINISYGFGIIILISSIVLAIFIYGFGEIIQLLEDIYWKI